MQGHDSPKPPSKLSLLWIGLSGGSAGATWTAAIASQAIGLPPICLIIETVLGLATTGTTWWLTDRYRVQKARRNGWWDGVADADQPSAEVIPLRGITDGKAQEFWVVSK